MPHSQDTENDAVFSDTATHNELETPESVLKKVQTSGSFTITPDLFEKLYLSPQKKVPYNVRNAFGNPTPLALIGFLMCLTPLSNILLGWRGAVGLQSAYIGIYLFFGGFLLVLASLLEFILGNTFTFIVFGTYGAFWLAQATVLTPAYAAVSGYSTDTTVAGAQFNIAYGFFLLYMGILTFFYMIAALRTNIAFTLLFFCLWMTFFLLTAAVWDGASGDASMSLKLTRVAGGFGFATALIGWYIFIIQLLASVDFPIDLPVGDLSRYIKGGSELKKAKLAKEKHN